MAWEDIDCKGYLWVRVVRQAESLLGCELGFLSGRSSQTDHLIFLSTITTHQANPATRSARKIHMDMVNHEDVCMNIESPFSVGGGHAPIPFEIGLVCRGGVKGST